MIRTGTPTATVAVLLLGAAATAMPSYAEVTISSAATTSMTCANGLCTPTASDAVLNAGDLEALLASGSVEVTTTGSGVQADDIRIDAPFGWSATSTLALDAYESISVGKPVAVSGQGGLAVTTNDGGSGGTFSFAPQGNVTFANPSSTAAIDGTSYMLVTTLPALASAIAADPSGNYALANSYDAAQDSTYSAAPIATTFMGNFEGLGNTISHLTISGVAPAMNLGLFAEVETSGTITSLHLTEVEIVAKRNSTAGAIAARSYGTVFNSSGWGVIKGPAGGSEGGSFGGLLGNNFGNMRNTAAAVKVRISSRSSRALPTAGGLVANNIGTIAESYASAPAVLAGPGGAAPVGGLIGFNDGDVENCYASGNAVENGGTADAVGGLVGQNGKTITLSYSTGSPLGGNGSYIGGLVGDDESQQNGGAITDTYWDMTTSGIDKKSQGAGNIRNDPGIKGRTTAQLQSDLPKGFDPKIWAENPDINGGLPYLIANPPQ